ncbi:thioesterase II family protein [Vibrio quintilis]|uniref:Linear gramicidin dehydrogenase LgrE n=1 Tax=Vibrio quintilis TaxID=1117707 RepID=A0A1M7YP94_9VIBR|nr:alpha/beta fold hydrolase [Vibrio quintilis]SHO54450.1 Linear gramicidin dehydrogenase LgrE [Vibrio quintilis]
MQLICFPYAGGSSRAYSDLFSRLNRDIHVQCMEYPGHGIKSHEPLMYELEAIAELLFHELRQANLFNSEYVFYGHSMGALVSYLVARIAAAHGYRPPSHMIVSGRSSPTVQLTGRKHLMNSDDFWQALSAMGGIPDELMHDLKLRNYFEQILRADFTAAETWQWQPCRPLNCPVTVWYGDQENVSFETASAWQQVTTEPVHLQSFPGKHFFIFDHCQLLCTVTNQLLAPAIIQHAS